MGNRKAKPAITHDGKGMKQVVIAERIKPAKQIVNPKDVRHLINADKIFALIHDTYGCPPNWTRPPGFISLSKIILEQQVSLSSANAHFLKLNNYLNGFTPSAVLKLTDDEMRNCHISRQKATYLRALSDAVFEGKIDFEKMPALKEQEIRKQLTGIKGIGEWTADIYLMFCLQSKDIFPVGDIAIVNTLKELSQAKNKEEIIPVSEKWKPYRSLAAYFLWHYYLKKRNRSSE
jgi:DNA-3-methyladenine glycosylase II